MTVTTPVAGFAVCIPKSAISEPLRINWHTVGLILARVLPERGAEDGDQLRGVRRIGIGEVSFEKGHRYLTAASNR